MKLATLRDGTRDGRLLVVRQDGAVAAPSDRWRTLQGALDEWPSALPALRELAAALDRGDLAGAPIDVTHLAAPLPRAYEWIDGSAFLNHVRLVRAARGAEMPPEVFTDPLIYQGGSSDMLGPRDPIGLVDPTWGLDFESEIGVILGDVALGTRATEAAPCVRLLVLLNDITLRNLVPGELAKNFGFVQSKPATAFAPFAVTPDELGDAWCDGRAHLRVRSLYRGEPVGNCETGPEMHFSFFDLIAHLARTRRFGAGTILGSGTISNAERAAGVSCLAERRMIETVESGAPVTPFMQVGDTIEIEAWLADGRSPFGAIRQTVQGTTS